MIPSNITREHVLKAIKEIDQKGMPRRRVSTRYNLIMEGKTYPPKYLITIANRYANGEEWSSHNFNGGWETNSFLKKMGFKIQRKDKGFTAHEEEAGDAEEEEDKVVEDALDFSFSFEADLRDHLASHLNELEDGLVLYQEANLVGIEYSTDIGRIDLLAVDSQGNFVVIELKRKGSDRATGQLLRYMGWVKQKLAKEKGVRGFIVTKDAEDRLRYAASIIPNVKIKEYEISFTFKTVELE